jgi:hypothetical protein
MRKTQKEPKSFPSVSFSDFLDDRNEKLRGFVRELTLEGVSSAFGKLGQPQDRPQDQLTALVKKLPNLEVI